MNIVYFFSVGGLRWMSFKAKMMAIHSAEKIVNHLLRAAVSHIFIEGIYAAAATPSFVLEASE